MGDRLSIGIVVIIAAVVAAPASVLAQVDYGSETPTPPPADRTGWTLGLGLAGVPDYELVPVPYVNWQGEHSISLA